MHGQKPFEERTDLTKGEIEALRCYRDLNYKQHEWSVESKDGRKNTDCDIINGCLRGKISFKKLLKHEKTWYLSLVRRIHAAITKSDIKDEFLLYKGVVDFEGLKKYKIGSIFTDNGFGSYSMNLTKAKRYSGKNENKERIFFYIETKKGDNAIYIDSLESEWLFQNRTRYLVVNIVHYQIKRIGKAIVYILKVV